MTTAADTPMIDAGRFILRKLERVDTPALFPTFSSASQCRYMSRAHFDSKLELADWLTDSSWNGRSWVAVSRDDGCVVGRLVSVPGRDDGVAEVGYVTVADRQGQGVARTCMTALIAHLFDVENLRRVFAEIDAENAASIALAERLGFVREGCLRAHEISHKGLCDMVVYGQLRGEWSRSSGV